MRFAAIKPHKQKLVWIDTDMLKTAELSVGLTSVDHGTFWRKDDGLGLAFVVYEYALFEDPNKQKYAAVFGKLIAGNAVIYAFDPLGETVPVTEDMISEKDIKWLPTLFDVEMAIARRRVPRPRMVDADGKQLWRFPEQVKDPKELIRAAVESTAEVKGNIHIKDN